MVFRLMVSLKCGEDRRVSAARNRHRIIFVYHRRDRKT